MELKTLNQFLRNLRSTNTKFLEYQEQITEHEISDGEGRQGEEGIFYRIYKVKTEDNLYLKVHYATDSYGDNEGITGIEFVTAQPKQVTTYVSI